MGSSRSTRGVSSDRRPARAIEEAGFVDVGAYVADTAPTVGYAGADRLAYRCDRVYTNLPGQTIVSHTVVEEEQVTSDHRPVVAVFDLGKAVG